MTATVKDRVVRVVSDVLNVPTTEIVENSSPDTLANWDSIAHISLVLALEGEFSIAFSDDDVIEMVSVGRILTIVREKGVVDGATKAGSAR
jgi:acyl carrier protein